MLTISKLKRWSINYYIHTAQAAETATRDLARAAGGLGEYYSERETRTPTWLLGRTALTPRFPSTVLDGRIVIATPEIDWDDEPPTSE